MFQQLTNNMECCCFSASIWIHLRSPVRFWSPERERLFLPSLMMYSCCCKNTWLTVGPTVSAHMLQQARVFFFLLMNRKLKMCMPSGYKGPSHLFYPFIFVDGYETQNSPVRFDSNSGSHRRGFPRATITPHYFSTSQTPHQHSGSRFACMSANNIHALCRSRLWESNGTAEQSPWNGPAPIYCSRVQKRASLAGETTLNFLARSCLCLTLRRSWIAQIATLKSHSSILPTFNGERL